MLAPNPTLKDFHAPGAVQAEYVLATLHEHEVDHPDQAWRADIFRQFPRRFAYRIAREYEETYLFEGRQKANLYLLDHKERSYKRNIPLSANDYELEQLAKKYAEEMRQIATVYDDDVKAVVRLWSQAKDYGIKPPNLDDPNITPTGVLHRLWDEQWWHRKLRRAHEQNLEEEAIQLGFVHGLAGKYISDESFALFQDKKLRNRRILSRMFAYSDQHQLYILEDLIAKSVSNPKNRRNELMCRVYGFETIADQLGHAADFLTITCPSRMHARLSKGNKANPKYDGTTPAQAQTYLRGVWAKIRSKLNRDGIESYGFRIAEPHQDGTPHWHLLIFSDPKNIQAIRDICSHYALQDSGDEQGAKEHRFKFEAIDKSKGSAIAYIAKYISKNIDGYAIDKDEEGQDAKSSAERVTAWASTWNIRQFQQFGGAPVSIWRELRKTSSEIPEGVLTEAFNAADSGNWALFLKIMGGPAPHRKNLTIHIAKIETDEVGKYGDPVGKKLWGLAAGKIQLPTRTVKWSIMNKAQLQQRISAIFPGAIWSFPDSGEPSDGGTAARPSAQRTDRCGEAALEFCQ